MIKIRKSDERILKKVIPNAEEYIKKDKLSELLEDLDVEYTVEVVENGIDGEPTDFAYSIEKVRDNIFYDNVESCD